MTEQSDYEDYDDAPEPEDRLADLITQLADYAGLTIAPDAAASAPRQPVAYVELVCLNCEMALGAFVLGDAGLTTHAPTVHLCKASMLADQVARVAVAMTIRSGS